MAAAIVAPQRGGGGGISDASDLTPEQRAEQAAMRQLQQIAERITITATADNVTFSDLRGERAFPINDKTVLKQEFSNTQAKLIETWSVDEAGRLVLTAKIESMTLRTPEQRAVFDRQ